MKFKHTRRSGILFVLLSVITLSIYSLFAVSHIAKEVKELGGKKRMPYCCAWLLGWITLGIVPLCYFASLSEEVGNMAKEQGIEGKTSFGSMFNWNLFGCWIIVGPFIAWGKFLRVLNRLEAAHNQDAATESEIIVPMEEEKPEEEPSPVEEEEEEAPVLPASEEIEEETVPEEKEDECSSSEEKPEERPAPRASENVGGRWRVHYGKKAKDVAVFNSREEAMAFARGLAIGRGRTSKIKVRTKGE